MKKAYPIIITKGQKYLVVYIPDFNINTQGKDVPEAMSMARDAIGIGMNLTTESFPEELRDIAFSINDMDIGRSRLIAEIAAEVFKASEDPDSDELFEEYKSRSLILGKEVWWMEKDQRRSGLAADINRAGNLVVKTEAGLVTLNSGDVSIRPV